MRVTRGLGAVAAIVLLFEPHLAHANCNVIPGPTAEFRGALGTLNRPFAIPGDVGQQIEITLKPAQCDAASPGFLNVGGGLGEDDYFVTILFEPLGPGAARNAVVLTTAANAVDCATKLAAALAQLGAGGAGSCQTVLPGTQALSIPNASTLEFRFPDTDAELAPDDDDHTFTGPATIAVTSVSDALPFGLASARCADTVGLVACVDELHPADGTCDDTAAHVDPVFGHFTALPPANDYQALCGTPNTECTGAAAELRFTIDRAGNALVPVDWRGVLLRPDGIPVPRLLRGETKFPAFSSVPLGHVRVPGRSFLASYAPSGRRLPPIFEPLADPSSPSDLVLFGSVDAPVGVMRIARRISTEAGAYQQCNGGPNTGSPCLAAEDCPSGTCSATVCYESNGSPTATACTRDTQCLGAGQICGPSLFDFSDRLGAGGVGPVLIPSTQYALNAQNPVPLEGLLETSSMFAFVELEAIAGDTDGLLGPEPKDLNADGDTTDAVLVLRDRKTGAITPIGSTSGEGRAATRIHEGPFSAPAVSVEGDVAAFLESEPLESAMDANTDGDVFDSILRVYHMTSCSGSPCAQELTSGTPLAVEAKPVLDGKSVAVSDGRVYFRVREADNAPQTTAVMSANGDMSVNGNAQTFYPDISADGRHVSMTSDATDLISGDTNGVRDVFVRDRDTDADGVFDELGQTNTVRVSVKANGDQIEPPPTGGDSVTGYMSADGRFITFYSYASSLGCPYFWCEVNGLADAFIRDRDADGNRIFDQTGGTTTILAGKNSLGDEANGTVTPVAITPDGRFFLMSSYATNLVSGDTSAREDVFVLDRDFDRDGVLDEAGAIKTVRISESSSGAEGNYASSPSDISADGRWVVFGSNADNLVANDTNGDADVFLRDRDVDNDGVFDVPGSVSTTRVSVGLGGEQGNSRTSNNPRLSSDGGLVAYNSESSNLVAGDTNGVQDVFVSDLRDGTTARVSVASDGTQSNGTTFSPEFTEDGRYVAFSSAATNLVSEGALGLIDVFLHDRVTGHTARVVQGIDGEPNGRSYLPAPARDGFPVAYESQATNLVASADANGNADDIFVTGPSTSPLYDLSGDGRVDDTVLYVLDTTAAIPTPVVLGPANEVSVAADGSAAFLRPEDASAGFTCNADGDFADACVYLSLNGAPATSLAKEANAIGISPDLVAALVPGVGGSFVQIWDRPAGPWSANLGPAADSLEVSGNTVSFRAAASGTLYVYDHTNATVTNMGAPAQDFVAGDEIVAFRTAESAVAADLNGDGDTDDDVLRVWDRVTQQLLETGQAVTPCRFEACRPGRPYRVSKSNVTFLTLEAKQGNLDLDGNGDSNGIVIQTFNARKAASQTGGGGGFARAAFGPMSGGGGEDVITLAGVSAGVCTTTGEACSTDDDCGGGRCFLPPGGCIEALPTACNLNTGCAAPQFCVPTPGGGGAGFCHLNHGPCGSNTDCSGFDGFPATTSCKDGDGDRVRLSAPLAEDSDAGEQLLPSLETREGTCSSDAECEPDEFCAPTLRCQPDQPELVTVGAPDSDRDGVDDVNDNCVRRSNPDQADLDADGAGDACDLQTCGDGIQTYAEECDGGNAVPGDGCDETCRLEPGALPACQNGIDDDGDGKVDLEDVGCANAADISERTSERACDDGRDNDGDGGIDHARPSLPDAPDDLGCASEIAGIEDPRCQNGLNDDGQPGTDFDGGASLGLSGSADPQCAGQPAKNQEAAGGCGVGVELMPLLAVIALARRRGMRTRAGR